MDVILSRAGLNGAQQLSLCLGAVQDEAIQTETKLADALTSLKRLQEVVRVTRGVHKAQTFAMSTPELQTSIARINQSGRQIRPLLEEILNSFVVSRPHESPYSSSEEEGGDSEWTVTWGSERRRAAAAAAGYPRGNRFSSDGDMYSSDEESATSFFSARGRERTSQHSAARAMPGANWGAPSHGIGSRNVFVGQKRRASSPPHSSSSSFIRPSDAGQLLARRAAERASVWPQHEQYRVLQSRSRSPAPVQQSDKKVALTIDGLKLRLSKLSSDEQEGIYGTSLKSALQIAQLSQVKGKEELVQKGIENTRAAIDALIDRQSSNPDPDEYHCHLEDFRQALSVVVRAILETDGKIEASGLRDLQQATKELQDTFPGSATRFKWCSIQLRKFLTAKYKRPTEISLADQNKLDLLVAEAREWRSLNDFSASRFGEIMAFVTETLGGSYEEWTPREDPRLAELIGIMIIRVNAFRDSHVQQSRLFEIHGWLYKMSGVSFKPTLNLSAPPSQIAEVYATVNPGFRSMGDVEEGFKQLSQANGKKHFGFLASTAYTFLATAISTQNQRLLQLDQLQRFNENLQALKEVDVDSDPSTILQSYQDLEKVLYLMRVLMHRRPEYQESSTDTVDALLSLFPPSQRPTFEYPSAAASSAPKSIEAGESADDKANEDEA